MINAHKIDDKTFNSVHELIEYERFCKSCNKNCREPYLYITGLGKENFKLTIEKENIIFKYNGIIYQKNIFSNSDFDNLTKVLTKVYIDAVCKECGSFVKSISISSYLLHLFEDKIKFKNSKYSLEYSGGFYYLVVNRKVLDIKFENPDLSNLEKFFNKVDILLNFS